MTNEEMYKKFVEKNNYMKNAMTMAGNKHLIGHIESVDFAKNKSICTMNGQKIEGLITQLVTAVMQGRYVVSNPSALQGFNFSLLNAKPVMKKEETKKVAPIFRVRTDEDGVYIVKEGTGAGIVEHWKYVDIIEKEMDERVLVDDYQGWLQKIVQKSVPRLQKQGVQDRIIQKAYSVLYHGLEAVDIDKVFCSENNYSEWHYNIMHGLREHFGLGDRTCFIQVCQNNHSQGDTYDVDGTEYWVLDEGDARTAFEESVDSLMEECGPDCFGDPARYITVDLDFAQEWLFNNDAEFIREEQDHEELKRLYCQYGGGDLDYNWDELSDDEWEGVRDKTIDNYVNEKGEDAATFMEYMNDNFGKEWVSDNYWKDHVYPDYDTLISDFGYEHELSPCEEVEQFDAYGKKFYAFKMD